MTTLCDQLQRDSPRKDFNGADMSPDDNVLMDIEEPLSSLKSLLEERFKVDLTDCLYCLQDTILLEGDGNLKEQCAIHAEGLVQINYELTNENLKWKINIVDVCEPAKEYVDISPEVSSQIEENYRPDKVRWIIDLNFKKEQERLNIAEDPKEWSKAQVRHWLASAAPHFNLIKIQLSDWDITGEELVQITLEEFRKKVPLDHNDHFWIHLQLLRECKFFAVIEKKNSNSAESKKQEKPPPKRFPRTQGSVMQNGCIGVTKSKHKVATSNIVKRNKLGTLELWKFLLGLLLDYRHRQSIQWVGDDGKFKLLDTENVAKLWGETKNTKNTAMDYQKLSRSMRNYYKKGLIEKVQKQEHVYKFVVDLKSFLGYSASQLNELVKEAELNSKKNQSNSSSEPVRLDVNSLPSEDSDDGSDVEIVSVTPLSKPFPKPQNSFEDSKYVGPEGKENICLNGQTILVKTKDIYSKQEKTALAPTQKKIKRHTETIGLDEIVSEEPKLPELSSNMLKQIQAALLRDPRKAVVTEGFRLTITHDDMLTLVNVNWLNDKVINFYMNLLIERSKKEGLPKVHAFATFFYQRLIESGHASVSRWTKKVDIFAQDLIIVPVHLRSHWCMAIIDLRNKVVEYYDSMGSHNNECLKALLKYLEDESNDKKKIPYDTSDWKAVNMKDIPQQTNISDCGVFACAFAEYRCRNAKITFSQKEMPYFRQKMMYEIITGKLMM
ncbi:hypothetical protein LSTR_LSTR008138 [Laodelphax striatellus]|uniref:Ubiquitin-like protease family profile domain-containing protein n=1 Tax=Laodelphax striatellus TaxID=195883 RepID=A0A482WZ28_LAOST|nr:hypothetical protein LSTR_LSTR008138 [Laodelphax striatellus]